MIDKIRDNLPLITLAVGAIAAVTTLQLRQADAQELIQQLQLENKAIAETQIILRQQSLLSAQSIEFVKQSQEEIKANQKELQRLLQQLVNR